MNITYIMVYNQIINICTIKSVPVKILLNLRSLYLYLLHG